MTEKTASPALAGRCHARATKAARTPTSPGHLKRKVIFMLAWVLAHSLIGPVSAHAQDVTLDSIRAVVNDGVVLDSELREAIEFFKTEAATTRQSIPQDAKVLEQRILDQLIQREVFRQHARQSGVAIDPSTINRQVQQIAESNNMDTQRFRQTLQQQGMNYALFRQNIEDELLRQRLIERDVQSRIRVSAQEIDDFVDAARNDAAERQQYRIQHILVAVPAGADSETIASAQSRAEAILAQLNAGADFSRLAAAESDGARALQGGDLGWRRLQELPDFIADAVRKMEPQQNSGILRSPNGLHLLRLAETQRDDPTQQRETLARHIFIAGRGTDIDQQLRSLRARIVAGEPFARLAARYSEDPNSSDMGGELPWFTAGQMPPALEQVADSLSVRGISQPFRTQYGWHLLQVLDRRIRQIDEQSMREQAQNTLRQRKLEQEIERWARQLRDESYVEIRS